jgi:hypothetical protein
MAGSSTAPFFLASSMIQPSSRSKHICWPSVSAPRSKARVPIATFQPSPGWPTMQSAGVRAPSKNTSLNSAVPVIWVMGRTSIPGLSILIRR